MPNHFSFYTSYDVLLFSIKSPQQIKSVSNIRKKLKTNTIFFWDKDLKHKSAALRYIFFCILRLKERGGGRESSIVNQKREKYKIYVMFPCSGRFKKNEFHLSCLIAPRFDLNVSSAPLNRILV